MKKGFTLVELLAVIIVLGVVLMIAVPLTKKSLAQNKQDLYNLQINKIKEETLKWAYDNTNLLPVEEDEFINIKLLELKKAGYIPVDVKNPKTGEMLPNDMMIKILFKENDYHIYVDENSGSIYDEFYNEKDPTIILNGDAVDYVEINSSYVDKGVMAETYKGIPITNIDKIIEDNGTQVSNIDTSKFKVYTITYSVYDGSFKSSIIRTVLVKDTTPPVINLNNKIEINKSDVNSYNPKSNVTVSDNSKEVIDLEVSGYNNDLNDKLVEFKACDSHNNCTIKKQIIKVK